MAWEHPNAVAQLINSLKALGVSPGFSNRRGSTEPAVWRGDSFRLELSALQLLHPQGSMSWEDADDFVVLASQQEVMAHARKDHPSRAVLNAASGGLLE
eukprot:3177003-Amphidinium_carterae.1